MSTTSDVSTTESAASTPAGTDPLPNVWCPDPPAGFTPTAGLTVGTHPLKTQVETAPKAAVELKATVLYRATFGATAPDPTALSTAFTQAGTWSNERVRAEAWLAYVKEQEVLSWRFVLATCADMRREFDLAVARQPTQVSKFPALVRFFGAAKIRARRAANTRARGNASKGEAAHAAPPVTTPTSAPTEVHTPTNATSDATTPTKASQG